LGAATKINKPIAHVVDVLGNVVGRDQPILRVDKAMEFISTLGEDILCNDNVVFFDPFCKAGEILLACAMQRCLLKSKKQLIDVDAISEEVFKSGRYFGLAPDERHHRLSLRTFLGNTHSHNEEFNHIIRDGHYLSEVDGTLDKDKFEKEFSLMIEYIKTTSKDRRIICVGNPPYQEEDGGAQKSAKPIYQIFTEALIECSSVSDFVVVIPSRWFAGGKGLDDFRNKMMNSKQIRSIKHFERSGDVFPTVDVDGGVCFLNWSENYNGKPLYQSSDISLEINLEGYDIIPDDPMAYSLLEKMKRKWEGTWVSEKAWARKPFGLSTDYFQKNKSEDSAAKGIIRCISRNKSINYIKEINIPTKHEYINKYKVCIPGAYGGKKGQRRKTLPSTSIFLVQPGEIVTETYMVIDTFEDKKTADNFVKFLGTTFSRYFLGLRKITQHIPRERWAWVPYLNMSEEWSDEKIYKFFNFSEKEIKHIKRKVQEWS
jgi:hypothetical protein